MNVSESKSLLAREILSAPDVVAGQERRLAPALSQLSARLHRHPPQVVVTCARGSSAHAATFGKYLIELSVGIPVAAAAPSVASVYERPLQLRGQLVLAISQSGRSNDLIAFARSARASGALTVAIVNDESAPLAAACEVAIPMAAGPELSVPATKTFVATLSVLMRMTARWAGDATLDEALGRLPHRLAKATGLDWGNGRELLAAANGAAMIGRGPTLAIAREAALKLKETCNLHAEAFSGAEFLHGPVALAASDYPLLVFMPGDQASGGMRKLIADLTQQRARLLHTGPDAEASDVLPALPPDHAVTDSVCLIQSFYSMLVRLAERRGFNPGKPPYLNKVTRTT